MNKIISINDRTALIQVLLSHQYPCIKHVYLQDKLASHFLLLVQQSLLAGLWALSHPSFCKALLHIFSYRPVLSSVCIRSPGNRRLLFLIPDSLIFVRRSYDSCLWQHLFRRVLHRIAASRPCFVRKIHPQDTMHLSTKKP